MKNTKNSRRNFVSIPYRYATNDVWNICWNGSSGVSIPYRYATNLQPLVHKKIRIQFQSLIGTLQTDKTIEKSTEALTFQSLIGTLQTLIPPNFPFKQKRVSIPYRYATNLPPSRLSWPQAFVSIPYRYATNEARADSRRASMAVSIPYRYATNRWREAV